VGSVEGPVYLCESFQTRLASRQSEFILSQLRLLSCGLGKSPSTRTLIWFSALSSLRSRLCSWMCSWRCSWLCNLVVQSGCAVWLCGLVVQPGCAVWLCSLAVQLVWLCSWLYSWVLQLGVELAGLPRSWRLLSLQSFLDWH
jgi:hypothetical protein